MRATLIGETRELLPASLYEAFPPTEARHLAERLEVQHTPEYGSWLNMAEIELSALAKQCLARRIAHKAPLEHHVQRWEHARNAVGRASTGNSSPTTPKEGLLDQTQLFLETEVPSPRDAGDHLDPAVSHKASDRDRHRAGALGACSPLHQPQATPHHEAAKPGSYSSCYTSHLLV